MHLLFRFALWLLHFLYSVYLALSSIRSRYFRSAPRSLTATRRKTPSHLALVLASQDSELCVSEAQEAFLACTERAVAYCRTAGIRCLSVYDRQGILLNAFDAVEERLEKCLPPIQDQFSQAEAVFPLTPPLSDDSDVSDGRYFKGKTYIKTICSGDTTERRRKRGRNRPAIQRHRMYGPSKSETFMLQLVSRETGKPTIAAVADSLLRNAAHRSPRKAEEEVGEFGVSISDLEATLEGERGYMAPDLTIVHHVTAPRRQSPPLELYSFPPWQLRLTEIYHNGFRGWLRAKVFRSAKTWTLLSELDVRRALDEYSSAEFRLGK
jgi:dehydrodolichyl diphosphate syntase complex subunit NUS1